MDKSGDFYRSWRISTDLTTDLVLDDAQILRELMDKGLAHPDKDQANLMALISSFTIFQVDSGLPAQATEMLYRWIADGNGDRTKDDPKYLFGRACDGI